MSTHVFNILGDEMECTHKGVPFHCELSWLSQKKHLGDWDAKWISHIFHGTPFLLERLTDEQNQSYSESTFWQIFVWGKKKSTALHNSFCYKLQTSKNENFWHLDFATMTMGVFQFSYYFFNDIGGDIKKHDYFSDSLSVNWGICA